VNPREQLRLEVAAADEASIRAWSVLADRLGAPPFLHPGWVTAWADAFAPDRLNALSAWRGEELVGVLPFIERRGVRRSPTNWHTPHFGVLAEEDEARQALVRALLDQAGTRADLAFLDASDPVVTEFGEAACALGRKRIVRTIARSPYVELEGRDWEAYRGSLPRKTRKEAERLKRRLGEAGVLTIEFAGSEPDPDDLLNEGFQLEGSGWKQARGSAILSSPVTLSFYTAVARWAHARGELLLAFLRLDGQPLAFDLCLEAGGRTYVLKGGFDPAFRSLGPGMVLTYESLRRAFAAELRSYELLGDADPYKLAWTDRVRERVRVQAFGGSPAGRMSHLAWSRGRVIAQRALGLASRPRGALRRR
jgi:CelD/BcsL family acetyltransferase involved in cellulose biosynthesis